MSESKDSGIPAVTTAAHRSHLSHILRRKGDRRAKRFPGFSCFLAVWVVAMHMPDPPSGFIYYAALAVVGVLATTWEARL